MNEEKELKLSGTITLKEYITTFEIISVCIVLTLSGIIIYFLTSLFEQKSISAAITYMNDTKLLFIPAIILTVLICSKMFISKLKKEFRNTIMDKMCTYTIKDEFITLDINGETMLISWSDIRSIVNYKRCFRIFIKHDKRNIVIPKSFFNNNTDLYKFQSIIKKHKNIQYSSVTLKQKSI